MSKQQAAFYHYRKMMTASVRDDGPGLRHHSLQLAKTMASMSPFGTQLDDITILSSMHQCCVK